MKYHYQFVSTTKVRIELIPENQAEKKILQSLNQGDDEKHNEILTFFYNGMKTYNADAKPAKITFMQFPKVALCSFGPIKTLTPISI